MTGWRINCGVNCQYVDPINEFTPIKRVTKCAYGQSDIGVPVTLIAREMHSEAFSAFGVSAKCVDINQNQNQNSVQWGLQCPVINPSFVTHILPVNKKKTKYSANNKIFVFSILSSRGFTSQSHRSPRPR